MFEMESRRYTSQVDERRGFYILRTPNNLFTMNGTPGKPETYQYPVYYYSEVEEVLIGYILYQVEETKTPYKITYFGRWRFKPNDVFIQMFPLCNDDHFPNIERTKWLEKIGKVWGGKLRHELPSIRQKRTIHLRPEEFLCECGNKRFTDRYGDCAWIDFDSKRAGYSTKFLHEVRNDPNMVWFCETCGKKHPASQEILDAFDRWAGEPPYVSQMDSP